MNRLPHINEKYSLFLPTLLGQQLLSDIRYITSNNQIQTNGLKIFTLLSSESEWKFGVYLTNAIISRATWNPRLEVLNYIIRCIRSLIFNL